MWVIAGKEQMIDRLTELLDELAEVLRAMRLLDRLGGEVDVLADVLRRRPLQVRDFAAKELPGAVEPPHQRRQPAKAVFDRDELQRWESLEDALGDHADDVGLHRLGRP